MYIFHAVSCNQTVGISVCPLSLLNLCDNQVMPCKGKWSQTTKKKHKGACTAFGKGAAQVISPERLDYHVSDDDSNDAIIYMDSSDDTSHTTSDKEVENSVEVVQRLYSVFVPPELCLECLEEHMWEKHLKATNRQPVYTGSSWTMLWRKNVTLKEAAKGCATLDH